MKRITKNRAIVRAAIFTAAAFAGHNIGSGFATGTEALQYFASWGTKNAFIGIAIAFIVASIVLTAVFITGYEQKFKDGKQVYHYFCGEKLGVVFDYYIYLSMIFVVLTMMSGTGATINQLTGIPVYIGAIAMGILCIVTALLGLEKLRKVLGSLCLIIVLFVFAAGIYVAFTAKTDIVVASRKVGEYVSNGSILQTDTLGIRNPYLSGISSAGLLIVSGFAWASATGAICMTKKEAVLSGIFSPAFFYISTSVVVYLLLVSMDNIVGKEVPLLAVIQHFLPVLSSVYSIIIVLAIYSTVSSRLFLLGDRFSFGNKKISYAIVVCVTALAVFGGAVIPFSVGSNILFSVCGVVGILFGFIVVVKFIKEHKKGRTQ